MCGAIEIGKCDICGKEAQLERTYFEYAISCDCCASGYVWELCKAYHTDWFSGGTTIYTEEDPNNPLLNDCGKYDSFEVALLEGIKHAVKILKENETIHR